MNFKNKIIIGQLNKGGEAELLNKIVENNSATARNHLEHMYGFLVASVVSKYPNTKYSAEEMIKIGNIGLKKCIDKYIETIKQKRDKKYKLSTYVTWWIKSDIEKHLEIAE